MTGPSAPAIAGIVAIVRLAHIDEPEAMVEALSAGGVRSIEFTLSSGGALEAVRRASELALPGVAIGAGTVTTAAEVAEVAEAGGTFCVSPNTDERVIEACLVSGLVPVPGAFTPTEVVRGMQAGADVIKLFPAGVVGPSMVRSIRGPFPEVRLLPTGAIGVDETGDYRRAGAIGVGLGSDLVREGWDPESLTAAARRAVESWNAG